MDNSPLTPRQIRGARAILDWSVHELAEKVGVTGNTISSIERKKIAGSLNTLRTIRRVLESAGVEFLSDEGLRPAQNRIRVLTGKEGLHAFYEEIYAISQKGNSRVCAITRHMKQFRHCLGDFLVEHRKRMEALSLDPKGRYLYPSDHLDNIPVSYEEPRYLPIENFPDVSIDIHGDMVATIEFSGDDIEVVLIENPVFADSFRKIFDVLWASSTLTPQPSKSRK